MITFTDDDRIFRFAGDTCSYWFRITSFGHLEHVYYGPKLETQPIDALLLKRTAETGSSIVYDKSDPLYVLDNIPLEWSGNGYGDFRYCPAELRMPDGSFSHDFTYATHEIWNGAAAMASLPGALDTDEPLETDDRPGSYETPGTDKTSDTDESPVTDEPSGVAGIPETDELRDTDDLSVQTLRIDMKDETGAVSLSLYYTVFPKCDVIIRRCVLRNDSADPLEIRRLLSMMVDLPDRGYKLLTFDGNWIKEAHLHDRPIADGMYVNASTTGGSSNRHNPGFIIADNSAGEDSGYVFGVNLIYSGNHFGFVERDSYGIIRTGIGINPHCFSWTLSNGESFETPEAVLTFSDKGYNGLSHNLHDFINDHIVRGKWKNKERPVLINNWESHFFKFTRRKLLRLAGGAAKLGVELFVLDDGWFGERDSDTAGLGDYNVNKRKLPGGMQRFADSVREKGLDFGLWFEPEMVNENSELFRAHPEYAVRIPGRRDTLGRNQYVLDLCNPEVREYIVNNVSRVIDDAGVSYVKWDMNRHISAVFSSYISNQGEFYHRYILGLYDVLRRIFYDRPHVLLESCSSGGNRYDLGMLCFSPQIWVSDNTDPVTRQSIQGGLSYLYPLSTMAAHISEAPHQQTLRHSPLATRFNTACFGALGYELDLKYLSRVEKKEIAEQIAFYKKHRRLFQYGRFDRIKSGKKNQILWQCTAPDKRAAVSGLFQGMSEPADGHSILRVCGLDEDKTYDVAAKPQRIFIRQFGGLVRHILPIKLTPNGLLLHILNRYYTLRDCAEHYSGDGKLLSQGILLNNQFMGTQYNKHTKLMGDYGSYLFVTELQ